MRNRSKEKNGSKDLLSDSGGGERLKGDLARVVIEANFEMVEHAGAPEQIEADTESFGETDWDSNLDIGDLDGRLWIYVGM